MPVSRSAICLCWMATTLLASAQSRADDWVPLYDRSGPKRPVPERPPPAPVTQAQQPVAPADPASGPPSTETRLEVSLAQGSSPIPGLGWQLERVKVWVLPAQAGFHALARIEGSFGAPVYGFYVGSDRVIVSPEGKFHFLLPFSEHGQTTLVRALNSSFRFLQAEYQFQFPEYARVREENGAAPGDSHAASPKRLSLVPSLGAAIVSYRESSVAPLTLTAISARISGEYQSTPPVPIFHLELFTTLVPVTASPASPPTRFSEADATAGYAIPAVSEPWRLVVSYGAGLSQLSVADGSFGYTPLAAPQISVALRKLGDRGNTTTLRAKYVALNSGLLPLSTSEFELAGGASWTSNAASGHPWVLGIDALWMSYVPLPGTTVQAAAISAGVGYGF